MKPLTYNLSLLVGLVLIAGGLSLVSIPAALIVPGALIIVLTLIGAFLGSRR